MFPHKTAHLEPLVDRCTAVAADYSLMTIEGIQTGEEIFVEVRAKAQPPTPLPHSPPTQPVVAREPPEAVLNLRSAGRDERRLNCSAARNKVPSAASFHTRQPLTESSPIATHTQERKLELEIKRLQSLLNTTNKELGHFKQHCCTLQEEGRSAAAMADEQVDQLRRASLEHSLRLQAAEERYGELQLISADETAALRSERCRRDDACAAADRRAAELEKQLREEERERGALTETIGLLRQQCQRAEDALSKRASDTAEATEEMAALKAKDRQREQVVVQMKAALAEEASTSEKRRQELREAWETMVGKEAAAIDLRKKNSMMLEYITKICQPHFAVVKDESLQPVNLNGFQVTQGHVLVPLILLLEGYSLLPTQLRSVIDMKSSQLHNQGSKGINYQTEAAAIPTSALAAGGGGSGGGLVDSADSYKNRYATAAKFSVHAPSSAGFST